MTTAPDLSQLLHRTAVEVRRCRAVVVHLEEAVHRLIDAGGPEMALGPLAELQAIDLLDQRLEDLALWIEALAATTEGVRTQRAVPDLTAPLRLAEMRRALADGCPPGGAPADAESGPAQASQSEMF